jgi:hypothetical protein
MEKKYETFITKSSKNYFSCPIGGFSVSCPQKAKTKDNLYIAHGRVLRINKKVFLKNKKRSKFLRYLLDGAPFSDPKRPRFFLERP